ncbi:AgmX/PglI C-terminal domain-containing protein [Myxococcota bacterium]|nr:AgmX/PglI C-terminal domain-containing protein [Myxococcota bacterium]MBU1534012.1 AgmX/PglI C-terminal domain-containing protein [Myxococcota bacterium]
MKYPIFVLFIITAMLSCQKKPKAAPKHFVDLAGEPVKGLEKAPVVVINKRGIFLAGSHCVKFDSPFGIPDSSRAAAWERLGKAFRSTTGDFIVIPTGDTPLGLLRRVIQIARSSGNQGGRLGIKIPGKDHLTMLAPLNSFFSGTPIAQREMVFYINRGSMGIDPTPREREAGKNVNAPLTLPLPLDPTSTATLRQTVFDTWLARALPREPGGSPPKLNPPPGKSRSFAVSVFLEEKVLVASLLPLFAALQNIPAKNESSPKNGPICSVTFPIRHKPSATAKVKISMSAHDFTLGRCIPPYPELIIVPDAMAAMKNAVRRGHDASLPPGTPRRNNCGGGGISFGGSSGTNVVIIGKRKASLCSGSATVHGKLDPNEIRAIIRAHRRETADCLKKELTPDAKLPGTINVSFLIHPNGTSPQCTVTKNLAAPKVGDCICTLIKKWKYTKPEGGLARVLYSWTVIPVD